MVSVDKHVIFVKILIKGVNEMRLVDYREKLGIGFNDSQKLDCLKSNLRTFLRQKPEEYSVCFSKIILDQYCLNAGVSFQYNCERDELINSICFHPQVFSEIVFRWTAYCNAVKIGSQKLSKQFEKFFCSQLEDLRIPYDVFTDGDGSYIFPKGATELDTILVSEVLEWMKDYQKTSTAFEKALRLYANEDDPRLVADQLRLSLETFFREFFAVSTNLDKCITESFGPYLKERGIPYEIQNEVQKMAHLYRLYNDKTIKHIDGADKRLLEFLLYQTGGFIRLLITLRRDQTELPK
jgi:hypothetical protein